MILKYCNALRHNICPFGYIINAKTVRAYIGKSAIETTNLLRHNNKLN